MSDIAEVFHAAQEALIRGSDPVKTALGGTMRLYTVVPQNAPLPYIVIGEDQILDDSDDCQDGSEIIATVHVWSKSEPPEANVVRVTAGRLRALLKTLTLAGHDVVEREFEDLRVVTDPDGSTHGTLTVRYLTVPVDG